MRIAPYARLQNLPIRAIPGRRERRPQQSPGIVSLLSSPHHQQQDENIRLKEEGLIK
jgi:hypothetical protein